jgi:hypothetical protein
MRMHQDISTKFVGSMRQKDKPMTMGAAIYSMERTRALCSALIWITCSDLTSRLGRGRNAIDGLQNAKLDSSQGGITNSI